MGFQFGKGVGAVALLALSLTAVPVQAQQQNLSNWLGEQLKEQAQQRFATQLEYGSFEVNTLTAELMATDIRLRTDIAELPAGLNQLLMAENLLLEGDWQLPGANAPKNNIVVKRAVLENVQLTVAYFATGRSNLHVLLDHARQLHLQRVNEPLDWSVDEMVLRNVVVNLFDSGTPLASVRIPELILPAVNSAQTTEQQVEQLLWPVLDQLARQAMKGNSENVTVDSGGLMRFLWREM
ncbi:MAG: hypothetical protein WEA82_05120 [Idiomarina sp.]